MAGICTPGLAACESCVKNPTKTTLSVLEASRRLLSRKRVIWPLRRLVRIRVRLARLFRLRLRLIRLLLMVRILCRVIFGSCRLVRVGVPLRIR